MAGGDGPHRCFNCLHSWGLAGPPDLGPQVAAGWQRSCCGVPAPAQTRHPSSGAVHEVAQTRGLSGGMLQGGSVLRGSTALLHHAALREDIFEGEAVPICQHRSKFLSVPVLPAASKTQPPGRTAAARTSNTGRKKARTGKLSPVGCCRAH